MPTYEYQCTDCGGQFEFLLAGEEGAGAFAGDVAVEDSDFALDSDLAAGVAGADLSPDPSLDLDSAFEGSPDFAL